MQMARVLKNEAGLRDEVSSLKTTMDLLNHEIEVLKQNRPNTPPPQEAPVVTTADADANAEQLERQMRALESEKAKAVRERDDTTKELLKMIQSKKLNTDELNARIRELEEQNNKLNAEVEEQRELSRGYKNLTDDLRGQIGDANRSHEATKQRLNGIIAELRASIEAQASKVTAKNSELTRLATELKEVKQRALPEVLTSGTQMSPPKPAAPPELAATVQVRTPVVPSESPDRLYVPLKPAPKVAATQTNPLPTQTSDKQLQRLLATLETAVASEMKAVQRHGHLLNLSNTSTSREMKLELDSMKLRLDAAKEQQNVLLFCLQTAETKLSEISPETAEKVKSSRESRMLVIQESLAGKMSELDHRSAGTSFMTGEKLRDLLPEAKTTWNEWKEQREKLMENLKEAVGSEVSPDLKLEQMKLRAGGLALMSGTRG
jgi:hypothetical protein